MSSAEPETRDDHVGHRTATAVEGDKDDAENLPLLAKLLNHVLTPGSSLTPTMWVLFNIIIFFLFLCWLTFLYAMPYNIHVWVFGFLGLGFALSTNWFMKIVFSSGLDFASQQQQQQQQQQHEASPQAGVATVGDATEERPLADKKRD